MAAGSITATLDVYNSGGKNALHQDLTVDVTAGTVSAPQFKLPIGDTYRFIVIFNYQLTATDKIAYAYADFPWLVDEFSEAVSFSENDIRYDYDSQDPAISAALSDGKIPNLDLDGDAWSNYEELRDKVNPRDPNSVPIVPTVEVRGQQDGITSTATVVVTARDNAHVEDLRLVDPVCGTTVISDTLTNNVDGSVTRTLTLRLDLLSVSKNPRVLQGLADDGVTPAQNTAQTLNFTLSGNSSQPYFVFTEPEENSEIEGDVVFRGIACSRNDIKVASAKFLNPGIDGAGWIGQRNPQTGDYELESSAADTTSLPDGLNELKVEVSDISNKTGQGSGKYRVVNDSQIKIVSPVGRRWVFGNETISAAVKNLPDSTLVVIQGDSSFVLSDSNSASARGTLKVGNLPEDTVIPLIFRAVRADGSEVMRKVEFTVRNKPQIFVQPQAVKPFRNWSTHLSYRVVNVDPNQLAVSGVSTATKGDRTCTEDAAAAGITVCSGEFPVKVNGTQVFSLTATRAPTPEETCGNNCFAQQDNTISSTTSLPNDIPEINAAIVGDDEPEAPEKVVLPSESPVRRYRLTVRDVGTGVDVFSGEGNSGDMFTLNMLEARTDYLATLEVLDGPGGNLQQMMFKDFTTGDIGLMGWWRFNSDPISNNCINASAGETVCDYSGRNNHGKPFGNPAFIFQNDEFLDGALEFDGIDDYVSIDGNDSMSPPSVSIQADFKIISNTFGEENIIDNRKTGFGYNLRIDTGGMNVTWYVTNDSVEDIWETFPINLEEDYFVCGTYDQFLKKISIYNNGQFLSSHSVGVFDRTTPSLSPTIIGSRSFYNPINPWLSGIIDELAIYNRELCSHEVWLLCKKSKQFSCGIEPPDC